MAASRWPRAPTTRRRGTAACRPAPSPPASSISCCRSRRWRQARRLRGSFTSRRSPAEPKGPAGGAEPKSRARAERGRPRDLRHPARAGRPRLQRLQGEDLPAPRPAPDAGAAARRGRGLRRAAAPGPGRGAAAVPRSPDRRDQLLPRPRGVRRPGRARRSRSCSRTRAAGDRSGSGSRAAPPARRSIRSPSCCASTMATCAPRQVQVFATDIDEAALAVARPRATRGRARTACRRAAASASSPTAATTSSRRRCATCASSPPHSLIRDPPFSRIDLISLPQPADLPRGRAAEAGDAGVPLRAAPRRLPVPGHRRERHPARRPVRAASTRSTASSSAPAPARARCLPSMSRRAARLGHGDAAAQAAAPACRCAERRGARARAFRAGHVSWSTARATSSTIARRPASTWSAAGHAEPAAPRPWRRKGLRLELRTALREAVETRRPVTRENVAVEIDDRVQLVNLTVEPLGEPSGTPLFLVVFADLGRRRQPRGGRGARPSSRRERRRGGRAARASCARPASGCKRRSRSTRRRSRS